MNSSGLLGCGVAAALLLGACGRKVPDGDAPTASQRTTGTPPVAAGTPAPAEAEVRRRLPLGGPIGGLTPAERSAFERGKALFVKRFTPGEGLGALYNATSCESCHSTPTVGGSAQLYRNFYVAMREFNGQRRPLPNLPSIVVPAFGRGTSFSLQKERMEIPADVGGDPVYVAQRNALPLFGTGLFEFVPDTILLLRADPDDLDGDGISGRFNTDAVGIGRFGTKSQANNVEAFTRPPLFNQMGITSDPFLGSGAAVSLACNALQGATDPDEPITDQDGVPDPEISVADLGDLIAFTRFLAPPSKLLPFTAAAVRGEQLFVQTGCTACHVPTLPSSRGPVVAYTDLLLHDMGPALADGIWLGIPQASALSPQNTGSEFRTQPLWGVSLHAPFLHDGRAETLLEAVEMHAGEGQASRDAFLALPPDSRSDLIEFLEHL